MCPVGFLMTETTVGVQCTGGARAQGGVRTLWPHGLWGQGQLGQARLWHSQCFTNIYRGTGARASVIAVVELLNLGTGTRTGMVHRTRMPCVTRLWVGGCGTEQGDSLGKWHLKDEAQ